MLARGFIGVGVVISAAVAFGCRADSDAGDASGAVPDGGSTDSGSGLDLGPDGGPGGGSCEAWCPTFLACRKTRAIAEINSRGVVAQCSYPDEATALTRCVNYCQTQTLQQNANGSELATPACLACQLRLPGSCQDPELCKAACNNGRLRTDGLEYEGAADLACWAPEGPAPGLECSSEPNDVSFGLGPTSGPSGFRYEGPVVVEGTDPWALRRPDGTVVNPVFSGIPAPPLTIGATVSVSLVHECPWWCESSMVVSAPDGHWTYAAWSGHSSIVPELSGLDVSYRAAACHSTRLLCGGALSLDLVPQGRTDLAVAEGQQTTLDGVTYSHGSGVAYFEILCTDFPGARVVGAVQRP